MLPKPGERDITAKEMRNIISAMDEPQFRNMLSEYVDEISDPKGREEYEAYLKQQEERKDLPPGTRLIRPRAGFCLKTNAKKIVTRQSSEYFDQKVFVNICGAQEIDPPKFEHTTQSNGERGQNVSLPYHYSQGRPDRDGNNKLCFTYDCVFHPRVIDLCQMPQNFALKKFVCDTAVNGLNQMLSKHKEKASQDYKIMVNMKCKGGKPATLSIKDERDKQHFEMDPLKHKTKLQKDIDQQIKANKDEQEEEANGEDIDVDDVAPTNEPLLLERKRREKEKENAVRPKKGEIVQPTYKIVERYGVDLSQYFGAQEAFPNEETPIQAHNAGRRPEELIISIQLPTVKSTKKANLEIHEKEIKFEYPEKFKLERTLPYKVDSNRGTARFDKDQERLEIRVPVLPEPLEDQIPKKSLVTETNEPQEAAEKENIEPQKPEVISPLITATESEAQKEYQEKVDEIKGDLKILPSEVLQKEQISKDVVLVQEVKDDQTAAQKPLKVVQNEPQTVLDWTTSERVKGGYTFSQTKELVFVLINVKNYRKEEVRYVLTEDELLVEVWDGRAIRKVCLQLFDLIEPEHSAIEFIKHYISVKMAKNKTGKHWTQIGIEVSELKDTKNRRVISNYLEGCVDKKDKEEEQKKAEIRELGGSDDEEDEDMNEKTETQSESVAHLEQRLHKSDLPKPALIPLTSDLILQIS